MNLMVFSDGTPNRLNRRTYVNETSDLSIKRRDSVTKIFRWSYRNFGDTFQKAIAQQDFGDNTKIFGSGLIPSLYL